MNAGGRLALYGAGLVVAFGAAYGIAGVAVPDRFVAAWAEGRGGDAHAGGQGATTPQAAGHALSGLSLDADGLALSPIDAPATTGAEGELSFQILDTGGGPVKQFTTTHEKDLHLIVVRSDGTQFRHVHPVFDKNTGTWSAPWRWAEAGTYRVFADFTPTGEGASGITLTRTVEVAGDVRPVKAAVQTTDEVAGYTVSLEGGLVAGSSTELTLSVSRGGKPVTTLQPYLGAFGHLVALREGDLAYLHVHPEGAEPTPGAHGGPDVTFAAEAPTAGRYLLYLDFQVDGSVHTAEFVLDAQHAGGAQSDDHSHPGNDSHSSGH